MTKLQAALDDLSLQQAIDLLKAVHGAVDIIEVGTPFMMEYGMEAVRTLKKQFPDTELLCDCKIMDAGRYEAEIALHAGADYVTVLGVTDDHTIADVAKAAHDAGKKAVADMICVKNAGQRMARLLDLGIDIVAVHTGVDQQATGRTPLDDLKELRDASPSASLAVAGGIKEETIDFYLKYDPQIVIVGSGITHAKDPAKTVNRLKEHIDRYNEKRRQ